MRFTIPQLIFLEIANPQKAFKKPAGDMSGALRSFSGESDFHAAQKSAGKQRSIYLRVSTGLSAILGLRIYGKIQVRYAYSR